VLYATPTRLAAVRTGRVTSYQASPGLYEPIGKQGNEVSLAAQSQGSSAGMWILLILFMAAAYFLIIRPQQRRRKQTEAIQSALGRGDEIVTVAGLYGTVVEVDDKTVTLEVAPGVTNRYSRQAVAQVVTPADRPAEPTEPETTANDVVDPDTRP